MFFLVINVIKFSITLINGINQSAFFDLEKVRIYSIYLVLTLFFK